MPPISRDELIVALLKGIDPDQDPELYKKTLQQFEEAGDRELYSWYNQQNDPQQANENAWTVAERSEQQVKTTDLQQQSFPPMSAEDRAAVMKDIEQSVDSLTQGLQQSENLKQDLNQQH